MYLQRIEMQGFKTFANRTVLEFLPPKEGNRGTTAIVGPNGSGKSNIADAVRWVLGEQSLKLLRGKKSEDVIFSGSEKRSRSGFAEVSLALNNEAGGNDIEYPEVVITRRIYRDGESEYLINKNKVKLQEVILLLARANFGQRTYSVIGQGMIDAILVASPKERKEFFDEAAGVKQYQLKRESAVRKLDASEENLKQAELILAEIEPRMRSLSRQVRRLEERANLEKELQELSILYFGTQWKQIREEMAAIDAKTKLVEESRKAKEKEIEAIRAELAGMETEETKSDGLIALQKDYEKEMEKRNSLREKEIQLKNQIRMEQMKAQAANAPALPMPLPRIVEEVSSISKRHDELVASIMGAKTLEQAQQAARELEKLGKQIEELLSELREPGHKEKQEKKEPTVPVAMQKELEETLVAISEMGKTLTDLQGQMQRWGQEEAKKRGAFFEIQRKMQGFQSELFELDRHLSDHRVERARIETRRETIEREAREMMGEEAQAALAAEPKEKVDALTLSPRLHQLRTQVAAIGSIDQAVVDEYKEIKERFDFLSGQVEDLHKTKASLVVMIEELDILIKKQSDASFRRINQHFGEFFKQLFDGGTASLEKIEREEDEDEVADAEKAAAAEAAGVEEEEKKEAVSAVPKESWLGLEIYANPPGKRVKSIHSLSGGERAMTSIALICAIMTTNPSPFVVLDEVDAALDESNASRFAAIIDELSHKTQFLVITHNRYTMQKSQVLYGVTMGEDSTSSVLSLQLEDAERIRGQKTVTV
ncbi:MAG: AAA family ATPase [Patescibacteria group bacterium]|jgi:chromosome segregation protein